MLDDIPPDLKINLALMCPKEHHAILANKLSKELGQSIFFVPRIYADELIQDEPYLKELSKILDPKIIMFIVGKILFLKIYQIIND